MELAAQLRLSPQTMSVWRGGTREPTANPLIQLSELFGIDGIALMTQPFVELLPQVADPHGSRRPKPVSRKPSAA
jgi:transcriptional regulator with XRE-family HTH domain